MLGLPSKEIKQAVETFEAKLNRLDQLLSRTDAVLSNVVAITEDVRAITKALREAIVRDEA